MTWPITRPPDLILTLPRVFEPIVDQFELASESMISTDEISSFRAGAAHVAGLIQLDEAGNRSIVLAVGKSEVEAHEELVKVLDSYMPGNGIRPLVRSDGALVGFQKMVDGEPVETTIFGEALVSE